jgi:hypothetical protein
MKIIINETQYKKLLIENEKLDSYITLFLEEVKFEENFNIILNRLNTYGFNLEMVKKSKILIEFLLQKLFKTKNFINPTNESDIKICIFLLEKIYFLPENINDKMNYLDKLYNQSSGGYTEKHRISFLISFYIKKFIENLIETLEPKKVIQKLSLYRKHLGGENRNYLDRVVNTISQKNNLVVFNKYNNITFNKKENSLVDKLITFIKDTPEIPNKTKTNFLKYIGSHYTRGQYSTFFSAVVQSKIIEKVGGGSNVTYKLGPNYQAWVENRLVAY